MKHYYFFLLALLSFSLAQAQIVNIPDANFKNALLSSSSVDIDGNGFYSDDIDLNNDGEVQVSEAELVVGLRVDNRDILSFEGLEAFTNLEILYCGYNDITSLDVTSLTNLQELYSQSNIFITSFNVTGLSNLNILSCVSSNLSSLDLSGLTSLTELNCSGNDLTNLDLSQSTNLSVVNCASNELVNLNVSGLTSLIELNCNYNSLPTINLNGLINLENLYCNENQLETLQLEGLSNLTVFQCWENQIIELDTEDLVNLVSLTCRDNQLTYLDLSPLSNLNYLTAPYNQLTSINIEGLSNLTEIRVRNNNLSTIDVRGLKDLYSLDLENNQLNSIFMKNGSDMPVNNLRFPGNPNLEFICVDDVEYETVISKINSYGYTDVVVNSYCSFVPGGDYYTIVGQNTFDADMSGCDTNDFYYPNLRFNVTNGSANATIISNSSGEYFIPVVEGENTIIPVLENPEYYVVAPESISVNFPTETSPYAQDFCITPNGEINDLEIVILPLEEARPGFDTDYKIIYRNKGNSVLSNSLEFSYNENAGLMELVSSSPVADTHVDNVLTWNFTDLTPFETREILVTLNLNTPTDTPPLNGGDDLGFVANIFPITGDEIPGDNNFQLKQVVVNSFDPNDKRCLQGETIAPEDVGKYVHYLIRFENTGTASAVNVVIKDEIDLAKYDVSTLIPLDGSHEFVTRIKDNIVEFIFEDINLPFDDANNDGYVLFKIKTLETLELGDTFSNDAGIYFDYNAPIITNDELTTVAENLSVEETELQNLITIYPNPATDVINLESQTNLESITVYDVHGRQIVTQLTSTNQTKINVSQLSKGVYFLNIKTTDGEQTTKFIKK